MAQRLQIAVVFVTLFLALSLLGCGSRQQSSHESSVSDLEDRVDELEGKVEEQQSNLDGKIDEFELKTEEQQATIEKVQLRNAELEAEIDSLKAQVGDLKSLWNTSRSGDIQF